MLVLTDCSNYYIITRAELLCSANEQGMPVAQWVQEDAKPWPQMKRSNQSVVYAIVMVWRVQ